LQVTIFIQQDPVGLRGRKNAKRGTNDDQARLPAVLLSFFG
jgi:hypothetical protein